METDETISQRVKQRRIELGMTQAEVAERAGIRQQSYQQIEAGETKRPRYLLEIASVLKCKPQWLLSGSNKKAA
jgi:transcriptional regulator with XRE-family HTH domain